MTKNHEVLKRQVLKALFKSARVTDEDIRWRRFRFNREALTRNLRSIRKQPVSESLIDMISNRLGLVVLRDDALKLGIHGFEKSFERQAIAEGMGAAGVQFFPTRQSASRSAFESAREAAYFGSGPFESQFFECPIALVMADLDSSCTIPKKGTILRDMREGYALDESIFDVLKKDIYFEADIPDEAALIAFEQSLRDNPISNAMAEKCEPFFNRRATIGVRDTIRWMMGSRHPWFDWKHAKELIEKAFKLHHDVNFNTPQIVYYTYDPEMDEGDFEEKQAHNQTVIQAFIESFSAALEKESKLLKAALEKDLPVLSAWILDIHHDYPDFDLESQGNMDASTHIEFLGHSIQNKFQQEVLGESSKTRLNINMRAHFEARGLTDIYLGSLTDAERETFFAILGDVLNAYDGLDTKDKYDRIPCKLFMIQDMGNPAPRENERLLDAFDLSQMTQLEHASYMRSFPEISEKLVIFFALTLRHMLETEHVPDLKPRDVVKDFMLLGLWGTRTPNIRINLYVDKSLDERDLAEKLTRSEIRFCGTEQMETHPLLHIREESKALRFAISQFVPLIEPSILRNLGTFTMAMEEFLDTTHAFKLDPLSLSHYAFDILCEGAKWGIKGSVTDLLTVAEYLVDNSLEVVHRKMNSSGKNKKTKK